MEDICKVLGKRHVTLLPSHMQGVYQLNNMGITANVPPEQEDFSSAPGLPAVASEKRSCP